MRKKMTQRKVALSKNSGWRRARKSRRSSVRLGARRRRLVLRHACRKAAAPCTVIRDDWETGAAALAGLSSTQKGRLAELLTF